MFWPVAGQGGELAGRALTAGRAVLVSEEDPADWGDRCRRLGIREHVQFFCRPFCGTIPTEAQWFGLVAAVERLHREQPLDLVVIDPLATLFPAYVESGPAKMLECLLPLQSLANQGLAVWIVHHPAKGKRAEGGTARGTSALTGCADILMEMSCYRRASSRDRRRRISGFSRYAATPRRLIIELNAEGTDYRVASDADGVPLVRTWPEVHTILTYACVPLTLQEILDRWPNHLDKPVRTTLWRWLRRATQQGLICCSGTGHRGNGLRYGLPGREQGKR